MRLSFIFVGATLALPAAAAGAAPGTPPGKALAVLESAGGWAGAALPELGSFGIPSLPRGAPIRVFSIPPGLWESLPAPDAAALEFLVRRVPGLDAAAVRMMTPAAAEALLSEAAAGAATPLELFTDTAFRGPRFYYIPQDLLVEIFQRYEVRVLTAVSGRDVDGKRFAMQAIVLGGGRIEVLYDRSGFTFEHPDFDNDRYTLKARVTESILGPGDMGVSGITAHAGFFSPKIQRLTQISKTKVRAETDMGSRIKPLTPIRRR